MNCINAIDDTEEEIDEKELEEQVSDLGQTKYNTYLMGLLIFGFYTRLSCTFLKRNV